MDLSKKLHEQEWSYFFAADDVDAGGSCVTVEATAAQRDALAKRLNVNKVEQVSGNLTLSRTQAGRVIYVAGTLKAQLMQNCVVSAEEIQTFVQENVEGWYADKQSAVSFLAAKREKEAENQPIKAQIEVELMSEEDDPEPLIHGHIDLGEFLTQHLSLSIPSYPHKEGVQYEVGDDTYVQEDRALRKNPFEALKDWKEQR